MVPCSQTIHFVLAHCLKRSFLSPTTLLHAMIALKKHFFPNIKTILVYIFTFSNYESKEDLGLSRAETQINFNMTSHFVVS